MAFAHPAKPQTFRRVLAHEAEASIFFSRSRLARFRPSEFFLYFRDSIVIQNETFYMLPPASYMSSRHKGYTIKGKIRSPEKRAGKNNTIKWYHRNLSGRRAIGRSNCRCRSAMR